MLGESAVLPCTYNKSTQRLLSSNISALWTSEEEGEMVKKMWRLGEEEMLNRTDHARARMPSLGPQTGDFSMTLAGIVTTDTKSYSLHISFDGGERSSVLCTVCLRVGGKSKGIQLNIKYITFNSINY